MTAHVGARFTYAARGLLEDVELHALAISERPPYLGPHRH